MDVGTVISAWCDQNGLEACARTLSCRYLIVFLRWGFNVNARSSGGNGRCGRLFELDFILGERLCAIFLDVLSAGEERQDIYVAS